MALNQGLSVMKTDSYKVSECCRRASTEFSPDCRGSVVLEFALVAMILLMLTAGIIDWSLTVYSKHMAQHAVREAARLAAVMPVINEDVIHKVVEANLSRAGMENTPVITINLPGSLSSSYAAPKSITVGLK